MQQANTVSLSSEGWLTPGCKLSRIREAAERLNCAIPTLRARINRESWPTVRIGGYLLIPDAFIDEWLKRQAQSGSKCLTDDQYSKRYGHLVAARQKAITSRIAKAEAKRSAAN